jgi:hypothetical protein
MNSSESTINPFELLKQYKGVMLVNFPFFNADKKREVKKSSSLLL